MFWNQGVILSDILDLQSYITDTYIEIYTLCQIISYYIKLNIIIYYILHYP